MTDVRVPPTKASEAVEDSDSEWAESPKEFFEEFTKRPDVHEILTRLARWQPTEPDRSVDEQ